MKKTVVLCIAVLLLTATLAGCAGKYANDDALAFKQLKQIVYHMSYDEVVALLGEQIPSEASGMIKTEWRLANGSKIWIWFTNSDESEEPLVTGYFVE